MGQSSKLHMSRGQKIKGMASTLLVLLCHKFILRVIRWQQGQRGRVRAMARAIATRTDVIVLVTWRSGRMGGSAGSITVGNTRFFDEKGTAWS